MPKHLRTMKPLLKVVLVTWLVAVGVALGSMVYQQWGTIEYFWHVRDSGMQP